MNFKRFLTICFSLIIGGILLLNVVFRPLMIIPILFLTLIFFFIKKKPSLKKVNFKKIFQSKLFWLIIFAIPILVRVGLVFLKINPYISDELTFYSNASAFANNQLLDNRYIALFPYLYFYIILLGSIFKVLGVSTSVVVIVNIVFDLLGAFIAYKLGKNLKDKKLGLIFCLIWLYNPLQLIWNIKCLPIIIVNTLIVLCLYQFVILNKHFGSLKYTILFSILLTLAIVLTNAFRPIMIILVIALIIYDIYLFFQKGYKKRNIGISLIIILGLFTLENNLTNSLVSKETGYKVASSSSGWSLNCGWNYDSDGQWYPDEYLQDSFKNENFNPTKIHNHFQKEALQKMKKNGLFKDVYLLIKKVGVLTLSNDTYTTDNLYLATSWPKNNIVYFVNAIYYFIFLILTGLIFKKKNFEDQYLVFLLFFCGLFVSSLLVEVSPRYFTPNFVVMMLIASYNIYNLVNKKESR